MAEFRKTRYLDLISEDIGDFDFGGITININNPKKQEKSKTEEIESDKEIKDKNINEKE